MIEVKQFEKIVEMVSQTLQFTLNDKLSLGKQFPIDGSKSFYSTLVKLC